MFKRWRGPAAFVILFVTASAGTAAAIAVATGQLNFAASTLVACLAGLVAETFLRRRSGSKPRDD